MKKWLSLILATVMLLTLAVSAEALVFTEDVTDEDGNIIQRGGVIVDNPYAVLYSEFFTDGKYPDDFAGVWVEDGETMYVFALVEGTDASKYEAVLGDYVGQYRFEYMPYSYNTLIHMRDVVFERLKDIMSGAGVGQTDNRIRFDVWVDEAEENGRIAQAMLDVKNEENLPDGIENAFMVEYGIMYATAEEECDELIDAVVDYVYDDGIDWAAQNRATESARALIGVAYDNDGNIIRYDYAGSWYDKDTKRLVVAVTEDGDMDLYRELFKDHDNVDLTTFKYSLKALRILQHEVFDRLPDSVWGAGVYDMENLIVFDSSIQSDEVRKQILQLMTEVRTEQGLPEGIEKAFRIEYGTLNLGFDGGNDYDTPPKTAVTLAVLPMLTALAALAISKKRR